MKKMILLSVLGLSLLMQGCSAMMALGGQKDPDFSVITRGQSKSIVESQPLKPVSTEKLSNGNTNIPPFESISIVFPVSNPVL